MANLRLPMFQIRRILQLRLQGYSKRAIADTLALARNTVDHYLAILEAHFPSLEEALNWQDEQLHRLLVRPVDPKADRLGDLYQRFEGFQTQLSKPGVTRFHLWATYKQDNPNGLKYTQFCERYKHWLQTQRTVMHVEHKAADKLFIDFAGKKLTLTDAITGQPVTLEFFVAILGCSQLTFAQALMSQRKEELLTGLQNALLFIGGVTAAIVPDNLKAAVQIANRYEPDLNEAMQDFAAHYSTCIYPARSRKPRDKALVEGAVNILYKRVYVPLQGQLYHGLEELNQRIGQYVQAHNEQLFQGRDYSRQQRFQELELALLRPLPISLYLLKAYRMAKVQTNCHVLLQVDKHYYSVPHRYVGQQVKLIYTSETVEIYSISQPSAYQRIAIHTRTTKAHAYSTQTEHLPPQQQWITQWSAEFFQQQARQTGPWVSQAIEHLLAQIDSGTYPQQIYRSCAGILSLARKVELPRLEKACERALFYRTVSYKVIQRILDTELDRLPLPEPILVHLPAHDNIRGASAYQ